MATIEIPAAEIGVMPVEVGTSAIATERVEQVDSFIQERTQAAWVNANKFLEDVSLAEIAIVEPSNEYSKDVQKWDQVIANTYAFFDVKPPVEELESTQSRKWDPIGDEAEFGWFSSEVRTGHVEQNGSVIPFRLLDTIVVGPNGEQKRTLFANRAGLPAISMLSGEDTSAEHLTKAA